MAKKQKIRILHCIYDSPGNKWINGGGAYRTVEIYKHFPENFQITILTGNYPYANLKIKNISFKYLGKDTNYFISRITYMLYARKFLKKHHSEYDIIIEDFTPYSPLKTYKFKNSIALLQNYFGINLLKKFLFVGIIPYLYELKMLSKYPYIIFSSEYLKNTVIKKIKKRISNSVISYGFDPALMKVHNNEKNYILYLGRIEFYQKGLDVLIETAKELTGKNFIIAGNGKDEKKLIKKIKNIPNVNFIGRVDGKKKIKLLQNSKFVVMPSRYESFGIVAIEAAAVGKPTIGVKNTGLQETIIPDKTGILIDKLSKDLLKKAIILLWNDNKLRKRLGINARRFSSKFNWKNIAKKQMQVYKNFLKKIDK